MKYGTACGISKSGTIRQGDFSSDGGCVDLDGYADEWCFFFFSSRRRHTRFDCDWSSDVCSSDLLLEIVMGADSSSGTMSTFPLLLNATIGTKFKVVTGYAGSNAVNYAMEQGEVEGDRKSVV